MNKVEAFKKILQIYNYTKHRPKELQSDINDMYYQICGCKGVNPFAEGGTTNVSIKMYRQLDIYDKVEVRNNYREWFMFINEVVEKVLDAIPDENKEMVNDVLIYNKGYQYACKKYNFQNPKLLFNQVNNLLKDALEKTYF